MSQPYASTLPRIAADPMPQDCERDSLLIMVPFIHGGGYFSMWVVLAHHACRIVATEFPEGWGATMREHGYPYPDENTERLLESLAWVQALRKGIVR